MIYFLTGLFAVGVLVHPLISFSNYIVWVLLAIAGGLFIYGATLRIIGGSTKIVAVTILACLFIVLGIVRTQGVVSVEPLQAQYFNGKFAKVRGTVVMFPEQRETRRRIVLGDVLINETPVNNFNVLVWHDRGENVSIKDQVIIEGLLQVPEDFETTQGRTFEYSNYLAKDKIYLEMFDPSKFTTIAHDGFSVVGFLENLKKTFISRMESVLPEPHSSLAGGILLGEKQSLGDIWQEKFRIAGLTHIVVLSGYNISIVVAVILYLLGFISILWSSVFSILGIVFFALLVGGGSTVIRASVMASLLILARFLHRPYYASRGLFIAGFVMVLFNPLILTRDLSFQLSFLATLGIILFAPVADRIFKRVPQKFGLREIMITTFSAQLFVFPWIIYTIGDFSVVSFFTNILVLPVIPFAMLASFVAGIIPFYFVALPAYWLLDYTLLVTEKISSIPYASITIPPIPLWSVVVVYVLLLYAVFIFRERK